jgi:hypothetical protein
LKTIAEVVEWQEGAAARFEDPAIPVCQLFFRWVEEPRGYRGDELVCGMQLGQFGVWLGPEEAIALPVALGDCELDTIGCVLKFGAVLITPGVWRLTPSFNAPGLIHAFVVLYGVPDPAPWERRIILAA